MVKAGPNYAIITLKALVGAALGAGVAYGIHHGPLEAGLGAVIGGSLVFGVSVGTHAVNDTKKLAALAQARTRSEQAGSAQALGKLDRAEKLWREVLALHEKWLGAKDLQTLATTCSLANVLRRANKLEEAQALYARTIEIYAQRPDKDIPSLVLCHKELALTLETLGRHGEALQHAQKALELQDDPATRITVARLHTALSQDQEAISHYRHVADSLQPETNPELLAVKNSLAACYAREKMYPEATALLKDLLLKLKAAETPNRLQEVEAFLGLAEIRLAQGAAKDVEPLTVAGLKVLQNHLGPQAQLLKRLLGLYRTGREQTGAGAQDSDWLILFASEERERPRDVLRENVAWVNNTDKTGWSPLQWACFLSREDLLKWLLRNGARPDPGESNTVMGPIHVAAAWGKMSAIEVLLEAGVPLESKGPSGWTPLLYSCHQGRTEVARQLILRGADPRQTDRAGRTPLHLAAAGDHLSLAEYLLTLEVDKQARTTSGRTPLHLAAANGQGSLVELLLAHQVDRELTDEQGLTAAQLAEAAGHALLVKAMAV